MSRRFANLREIALLDPAEDWLEIYQISALREFPWDYNRALELALFRTFAVPYIGELLDQTGEFRNRVQRRYDDTALLLGEVFEHGPDSDRGREAIRNINRQHAPHHIPNEQMLYVLGTFVFTPLRWLDDYGWRPLHRNEREASFRYYRRLGELMNIRHIPPTLESFENWYDEFERQRFAFTNGGRVTADSTLDLLASWQPAPLRRIAPTAARALMDAPLRAAFNYDAAPAILARLVTSALKSRARVELFMPPRRRPRFIRESGYVRSYPHGYEISKLGSVI